MTVLGPLFTKQDFGGDLDLDEYDNSIENQDDVYVV